MTYLSNPICNFDILTEINYNKKKNILSTCFFKMLKHYKNFNIYVNGIKKLLNLVKEQDIYILRIFIDEHIKNDKNIFELLYNTKNVELIIFKCDNYIVDNYHKDVFGALVRLFPLFDFDNNDSNNVIIIDIDLNNNDLIKLKNLINYKINNNKQIIGIGSVNDMLINNKYPHYYCGLLGFFNIKFNKDIIINFIKNAKNIKSKGYYNTRESEFDFGTDELFINEYLIYNPFNGYYNKLTYGTIFNYDINWFIYYNKENIINNKNSNKYLKYILGKFYKKNMNNKEMINKIDNLTYQQELNNNNKIYISKRFYKLITHIKKNNLLWFNKDNIDIIYKYYNNIIDSLSIIFFKL